MSIKYSLVPNQLTDDPDDYRAVVQDQVTRTLDDIIEEMLDRGSTVTKADILSVLEDHRAVVNKFLRNGDNIRTPLMNARASILGVFIDRFDSFDPSRHKVQYNTTPGPDLEDVAEDLQVEKVSATQIRPVLEYFKDFRSDTESQALTPGGSARLRGEYLKIDPEDTEQGIFILGPDGAGTKVELIMRNMPSDLMFEVPEGLEPGEYDLEVRAKVRNNPDLLVGRLNTDLVVS